MGPESMQSVPEFIAQLPLCREMSDLEVTAMVAFLESRRFPAGSTVFQEGEKGNELFIVRSGRIGSYVTQPDLTRREVYEFAPGVLFGEMAIIEDEPRSATCYAKEDSELLVLDGIDFYRLVWEHPAVGVKLLAAMARVMTSWLTEASGLLGGLMRWGETARKRSITDSLTGLFNRRFLEETMASSLAAGAGAARSAALIMLDIDHFRDINARFGAAGGDAAITATAEAFSPLFKEGEIASRLSGDEFAVFLPKAGMDRALALAEAMRSAAEALRLQLPPVSGGAPEAASITVSLGVASTEGLSAAGGIKLDAVLVDVADKALFKAKEAGRNRVMRA